MTDNKWIDKLNALMRLAEDPATTEEERANIIDKVTYLMTKYGIEQDMLAAKEQRPFVAAHRKFVINGTYGAKRMIMLNAVSIAFGCFMVQTLSRDGKCSVFGTDEDIERVFMLYMSLNMQMDGALVQAQAHKPSYEHGKTFNSSFVAGFVHTVSQRIQKAARRAKEDLKREHEGNGMELVLLNKQTLVTNLMTEVYPNLTSTSTHVNSSVSSRAGYGAGQSAGQRADIGGSRISGSHSARRAISN